MNEVKQFFKNHTISAQSFVSGWAFLTLLWSTSSEFRGYLMAIYNHTPVWLHNLVAGVIVPALVLWRTQKATTVTVTAEVVPGAEAETHAAVAAAKVDDVVEKK